MTKLAIDVGVRSRHHSLGTVVRAHAQGNALRPALIEGERVVTFADLERRTNRLARVLLSQGVVKGDRIALLLNDGYQFMEMIIAAGKVGAIAMLLNWRLSPGELAWILAEGSPVAMYRADRFASLIAGESGVKDFIIADDKAGETAYEYWATEGPDTQVNADRASADPLIMMFTSGPTGKPKGCVHSHGATIISAMAFASRRGFVRDDRNLSTSPLFHVAGLGHAFATLVVGGANVFVSRDSSCIAPVEVAVRHG